MKALITGGTSGLGRGAAYQLANQGWDVTIIGRNSSRGQQIADKLGGSFIQANLSLISDTLDLATKITEPVDALILCAGALFNDDQPLTREGLDPTFALNYLSRFALSQALLPRMNTNGRIIMVTGNGKHKNVSTDWAAIDSGLNAAYKAALATDLYATELAQHIPQGQIHTCYPGFVRTDIMQNMALPIRLIFQLLGSSVEKGSAYLTRLATGSYETIHWDKAKPMQFSPPLPDRNEAQRLWDFSEQIIREKTAVF